MLGWLLRRKTRQPPSFIRYFSLFQLRLAKASPNREDRERDQENSQNYGF
jgi:hypothetical protein